MQSTRKNKKLMAIDACDRIIHFGQKSYSDYTKHKNDDRRMKYYARHYAIKNITNSDI
jgi:hypothetical protein